MQQAEDEDLDIDQETMDSYESLLAEINSEQDAEETKPLVYVTPNAGATKEELDMNAHNMRQVVIQKRNERRSRVLEIKRYHVMNGLTYLLSEPITRKELKELIDRLTKKDQMAVDRILKAITTKIERLLKQHIPLSLKHQYTMYKDSFIEHPGFMYVCNEYYGGYKIWVKPDIPYYIMQFSEMGVLYEFHIDDMFSIDKMVERYYLASKRLIDLETRLAIKFTRIETRLDLLEMNVKFYDEYMLTVK